MRVTILPSYARKIIPLSLKKRLGAVETIESDTEGLETRYCLGCGTRKTFDRHARDKCDRCLDKDIGREPLYEM